MHSEKFLRSVIVYTIKVPLLIQWQTHSNSTNKFYEKDIIKILEILIKSIFVMFGGCVCQWTIGIPMCTNCVPLACLFIYSYDADFIDGLLKKNYELSRSFNISLRYI